MITITEFYNRMFPPQPIEGLCSSVGEALTALQVYLQAHPTAKVIASDYLGRAAGWVAGDDDDAIWRGVTREVLFDESLPEAFHHLRTVEGRRQEAIRLLAFRRTP